MTCLQFLSKLLHFTEGSGRGEKYITRKGSLECLHLLKDYSYYEQQGRFILSGLHVLLFIPFKLIFKGCFNSCESSNSHTLNK